MSRPAIPGSQPGASAHGALVVCPDAGMAAEVTGLLTHKMPGPAPALLKAYPPANVLAEMVAKPGLQFCFLDICSNREVAFQLLSEINSLAPDVAVVALLSGNAPDLILRCLRQGASEFLIQPFTPDQLEAALRKLARVRPETRPGEENRSRVYCVMPGKGACGATTLACNLAYQLQRPGNGKVLLADLDRMTGTLAFLLKLKSNYSFLDVLTRAASLDADLWKSIVTSCHGLDVLLSPDNPVDAISEPNDPAPLLRYSRPIYSAIVADTSGPYGDWNLGIAGLANEVLLVTTNELPSLHATQRALAYLDANGIERSKIRLVVNRYRPDLGLPQQQVQAALHSEVFQVLPSDADSLHKALLEGRPALPTSKFGKSVTALAQRLAGGDPSRKASR